MSAAMLCLPRPVVSVASSAMLLAACLGTAPAGARANDISHMIPQQLVTERCAACHGADGNGSEADAKFPKLAGQTIAYLAAQLDAFRSGARASDVMTPQATDLSDAQIAGLARFYSRQPVKPDTVTDKALAARGEEVFFTSRRGVPACAACHSAAGRAPTGMMHGQGMMGGMMGGMGMMGNMADVPNLVGQRAAYVVLQLDAFAAGTRPASVMGAIASALDEGDRKAVAAYLSGLGQ